MKLLIFAHTPPPFHGQSYMVKLMLDGLQRTAPGIEPNLRVFHINAKLSSNLETIGKFQFGKVFRLLSYCVQAYFHRFVNCADTLYYVPAPGIRAAVYRDWIVMSLCRPVFRRVIFHWHASGLTEWLDTNARGWERKITGRLLGGVDLSIVLSEFSRANAARFSPRAIAIVPNGIPDPCPDFEKTVLPERNERLRERNDGGRTTFTILFLGACTGAKGIFAALDAIEILDRRLKARKSPIDIRFMVAGEFASAEEHRRFESRMAEMLVSRENPIATVPDKQALVVYNGFVTGDRKNALLRQADCFCFPSKYAAEGQPVVLLEALAFGLPIVATKWRGIPEVVAGSGSPLIDKQDPIAIADAIETLLAANLASKSRQVFLTRYQVDQYVSRLAQAFATIPST